MENQPILTLTMNPALDKSAKIDNVVAERKLRCSAPSFHPGGGGINVSRAVAHLGGQSTAVYLAGGPFGQMLQSLLEEEGVVHHPLEISGLTRESFTVLEEATGQQYRFSVPGPQVKEEEWQWCLQALADAEPVPEFVVASGSLPPGVPSGFYARVRETTRRLGARLIVDSHGDPLGEAVDEGLFLVKPNMRELGMLTGRPIESEIDQENVARQLVEEGRVEVVLISLGAAGALLVTRELCQRIRAPTVAIESKVGAGDSMVGGLVLSLARGRPLTEAARFAVAAGAAAVMTPGTRLCRREDTEKLFDTMRTETASSDPS
jgi:6-phosphofructokinase 2